MKYTEILICPKRVLVLRLFNKDKIEDSYIPNINSENWVSVKNNDPYESDIFFVKNEISNRIEKAFYLHHMYYAVISKWYHTKENIYIDKNSITHWMPFPEYPYVDSIPTPN